MNNMFEIPKPLTVDQDQIKNIVGALRKHSANLEKEKNRADLIWNNCESFLDANIIDSINTVKDINRKRYNKAIEELNSYINRLETVANIWQGAEEEIKSSSIELERVFSDINKSLSDIFNNKNN